MLPGEPIRLGPVPTRSGPRTRADVERNTSARLSEFMQERFGASPSGRLGTEGENRLLSGRSLRPPTDGHGQRGEDAQRREARTDPQRLGEAGDEQVR